MSKQYFVLIALLSVATGFIFNMWREGVLAEAPAQNGKVLSSIEARAKMTGQFRLSEITIEGPNDSDIQFMVILGDGSGWGDRLIGMSKMERKELGETNVHLISNIGHELRKRGIYSMLQESSATMFEDNHGNYFIRGKNFVVRSRILHITQTKKLRGEAGDGWKIYW